MKILVTGAAGFIGSHLCEKLIDDGHIVHGLDNFDPFYDRKIKESNLDNLKKNELFSFSDLDLEDEFKLKALFDGHRFDCVVHLAAKAGVRPSLKDPLAYVQANVKATVNLLECMNQTNHKNLVFASSSSIYGKSKNIPFTEDDGFDHAISVYATSKQSGELFTKMYHNLYNLDVINLRFFTVYGPRQRPDLAIHKFLKANIKGDKITLFGDGSMARDYTYVSDTVQGVYGAVKRVTEHSGLYETYNLGNSTPVTLTELIEAIEKVTGKKCNIERIEVPPGDVPITFADISNAEKNLSYRPEFKLEKGLKNMLDWINTIY